MKAGPAAGALMLLLALVPAMAQAAPDVIAAVNSIRARGCNGKAAVKPPLRHDKRLDRAAAALASGAELEDALQAAGYRATQAALLEVSGDSAAAMSALAEKGCKDIIDPVYGDAGISRGGGAIWLLLAAPLEAPAASEATAVSARVLALVNEARREKRRCGLKRFGPAPPLAGSATLQRAARAHAEDMAQRGVMGHAGGDGSTPAERATRAGYAWTTVGENVASGQSTPEQVVEEWLGSPRHCENIMDADYTEMGVAVVSSDGGVYWAQLFGTPAP